MSRAWFGIVRRAVSTVVVIAIIVVLLAVSGIAYYFLSQPKEIPPTTVSASATTSGGASPDAVKAQLKSFAATFDNRDPAGIAGFYTQDATVVWSGNAGNQAGQYTGRGNIELLYAATIGKTTSLNASFSNIQTQVINPNTLNVTLSVFLTGHSTVLGDFNVTVNAKQEWVSSNGVVEIQKETWNYLALVSQYHVSATVFPQWGLQMTGGSPNLATEHTLEWNLAPYLAAVLYFGLFVVVVSLAWVRLRKHRK